MKTLLHPQKINLRICSETLGDVPSDCRDAVCLVYCTGGFCISAAESKEDLLLKLNKCSSLRT